MMLLTAIVTPFALGDVKLALERAPQLFHCAGADLHAAEAVLAW